MRNNGSNVLVVEDDVHVREFLCTILAQDGYEVHAASDGLEALRLMRETQHDIILTDYGLPRMDGLQFLKVARAWWPQTPVVFVSGEPPETAELAMQQGAYAWLSKPCDHSQLLRMVCEAARTAAALREKGFAESPRHGGEGETTARILGADQDSRWGNQQ